MIKLNNKNAGVQLRRPELGDYVFGATSPVREATLLESGDWTPYLSASESQWFKDAISYLETLACVSFSGTHCTEAVFNLKIDRGLLTEAQYDFLLKEGYIVDGKVKTSERYIAKLSGTDKNGNTGWNVAKAMADYGLVPESLWPDPEGPFSWEEYYKEVPEHVKRVGECFLRLFKLNYEVVYKQKWPEAIKQGPLQVFVHAWEPPVDGVYPSTTAKINHAVELVKLAEYEIFDHYEPYIKVLAPDFIFYDIAFLFTINARRPNPMELKENYLYQLVEGKGGFGLAVGGKLLIDDTDKILASFMVRNNGNTAGKCRAVSQADWDSVPHYNLKMESLDN